jgi:preprotein translocase subunit SecD
MKLAPTALMLISALTLPGPCLASDLIRLEIAEAARGQELTSGAAVLNVRLSAGSARLFGEWTARHIGQTLNFSIDGRTVMQPRLMSAIQGGALQMSSVPSDEIDALIPLLLAGTSIIAVEIKD